jgi:hypothetical protein
MPNTMLEFISVENFVMVRSLWSFNFPSRFLRNAIRLFLAGLISVGAPIMAAAPVEIRSTDFTLAQQGILKGTVLNVSAQPVSGVPVHVLHNEKVVASATSDEQGQFSVQGLRNGAHVIQVGSVQQPVRFWGESTAPPASTSQMAIVVDEEIVRGQMGYQPGNMPGSMLTANTGILLLIGGAVAIVLGTTLGADNDDSPVPPASP